MTRCEQTAEPDSLLFDQPCEGGRGRLAVGDRSPAVVEPDDEPARLRPVLAIERHRVCLDPARALRCVDNLRAGEFLGREGVATNVHYPLPLHLQPAYEHLGYTSGDFPAPEAAARRMISLPLFPELGEERAREIADLVGGFLAEGGA